ncbi:glycosyltransferase family 4 protein [Aerococcus sp.]|uniref:glycosyltransferase family 4 protein n=1 Tax=Aerococcus sp. TaxID=1872398 RepID=UPI0028A8B6C2|nr:glycosyltransferase family 4 protein [Aerococcus sp.]
MNLLFLSLGRIENIKEQGIYTDLLRKFRDEGHTVYVLSPRERRYNLPTTYIIDDGIHSIKVKVGNIIKINLIEKGISTLLIQRQYISAIKKYLDDVQFDLILYATPPITIEKVVKFVKDRDDAKTFLLLKDIFPQNAIDLKLFKKKGILHRYFRCTEDELYKISDYIGTMSPANTKYLLQHNPTISPEIVCEVPNTLTPIDIELNDIQKCNIRRKFNIPLNKLMVVYGGNLGRPQGIENLLECLKQNEKNKEIYIAIAGSGTEFSRIKQFIKRNKLKNCQLIDFLPKTEYDMLVNSADAGLIFLDSNFSIPNYPSRLLSYMQAGIPIIASTDLVTDIGRIAQENKFGFWNLATDINGFNKNLLKLENDSLRLEMGKNGREYFENNYTSNIAYEIIITKMREGI